jgi:hypothetical protein
MYRTISDKLIENVLKKADENALKERSNFNKYAEVLEEYVQSHKLIVGEQTGVDLIIGRPFNINSYPYILYSNSAEDDGFNIADELYSKTNYKYIQAISQLNGGEIQVKIADRQLAKIIQLEEYKGIDLATLTDPKTYTGWFNKNLLCMSVDVQMARIYRQLSSPAFVDKWDSLLEDEHKLYELLKDKIKNKTASVRGGDEKIANSHYDELNRSLFGGDDDDNDGSIAIINDDTAGGDDKQKTVNDYICDEQLAPQEIIDTFGSTDDGDYFIEISGNDDSPEPIADYIIALGAVIINQTKKKIQITNVDADELEKILKQKYGENSIQRIIQLPKIPGDERLRRYTYYLIEKDKRQPIIDLFNIDRYDPIPQKNNYVHPLVKIRMLVVDIWTLKLILEIGNVDKQFAEKRIAEMYAEILTTRDMLSAGALTSDVLDILHNGYSYIGTMDKDQYTKSKIIRKMRNQSEIYIPNKKDKVK